MSRSTRALLAWRAGTPECMPSQLTPSVNADCRAEEAALPAATRRGPHTRTAGRTRLRIAEGRPWAGDLVNAFTRLTALPRPIT